MYTKHCLTFKRVHLSQNSAIQEIIAAVVITLIISPPESQNVVADRKYVKYNKEITLFHAQVQ